MANHRAPSNLCKAKAKHRAPIKLIQFFAEASKQKLWRRVEGGEDRTWMLRVWGELIRRGRENVEEKWWMVVEEWRGRGSNVDGSNVDVVGSSFGGVDKRAFRSEMVQGGSRAYACGEWWAVVASEGARMEKSTVQAEQQQPGRGIISACARSFRMEKEEMMQHRGLHRASIMSSGCLQRVEWNGSRIRWCALGNKRVE
jgi:hypothetical protein